MLRVKLYVRSELGEQYRGEILATPGAINSIYESLRPDANPWLCQKPRDKYLSLIFDEVKQHEKRKTRQAT
jgi:hypothetical protein